MELNDIALGIRVQSTRSDRNGIVGRVVGSGIIEASQEPFFEGGNPVDHHFVLLDTPIVQENPFRCIRVACANPAHLEIIQEQNDGDR